MTHRIGIGTLNVTVNLLAVERRVLGELSVVEDVSMGNMLRRLAMDGLRTRRPDLAAEMENARRERRAKRVKRI